MELITSQLQRDRKDELDRKDILNNLIQQLINCLLYKLFDWDSWHAPVIQLHGGRV